MRSRWRRTSGAAGFSGAAWQLAAAQVAQVDGAHGRAVAGIAGQEVVGGVWACKTQAAGQLCQTSGSRGRLARLVVVQNLQMMFHRAQENIAIRQHAPVFRGQQAEALQAGERIQGVAAADFRLALSVDQLERLGDKFDVADRAFAQLYLAPGAAFLAQVALGALFHGAHGRAYRFGAVVVEQGCAAGAKMPRPGLRSPATSRTLSRACLSHSRACCSR